MKTLQFKDSHAVIEFWDNLGDNWLKKSWMIETIIFNMGIHYSYPGFWYMDNENSDRIVTALNIPKYSESINDAWKIAEKMGIALVPQSELVGDGFLWLALDLTKVVYNDIIELHERYGSSISRKSAPEAICLAGLISKLELE